MTSPANAIYVNEGDVAYSSSSNNGGGDAAIGERSIDEIEGSLLPVATQVNNNGDGNINSNNNSSAMAAVPVQVFEYDAAMAAEQAEHQLEQQSAELQEPLIAHHIPSGNDNMHNPESIADDSRNAVKHAERTGIQRAEEEMDAIRKANRKVFAHNYFEEQQFQTANEKAKRRDGEGLQVLPAMESSLTSSAATENSVGGEKQDDKNSHNDNGGGYRVQEYNIADAYETQKYDVKEYKSVYD